MLPGEVDLEFEEARMSYLRFPPMRSCNDLEYRPAS
jgi:hypothetical protein